MAPQLGRVFFILYLAFHHVSSLKARWFANGKKPAPFSKKYRDANPEASKYGGYSGSGSDDDEISNTKMLMFFGICFVLYFMWSRNSGTATTATTHRGGNALGSSSRGARSTTTNSRNNSNSSGRSTSSTPTPTVTTTTSASVSGGSSPKGLSNAAQMREARLRALQNRDKNLAAAARDAPATTTTATATTTAAAQQQGGSSRSSSSSSRSSSSSSSGGAIHGFSSSGSGSSSSNNSHNIGHSDATADDRARLIFPDDNNNKED